MVGKLRVIDHDAAVVNGVLAPTWVEIEVEEGKYSHDTGRITEPRLQANGRRTLAPDSWVISNTVPVTLAPSRL